MLYVPSPRLSLRITVYRQVCPRVTCGSLVYSAAVNVDVKAKSSDETLDELGAFRDAGAQRLYLQLLDTDDTDQVHQLGAEVKPRL